MLPSSELGVSFVTSEENEFLKLIFAARDEMKIELRLAAENGEEHDSDISASNERFSEMELVEGADGPPMYGSQNPREKMLNRQEDAERQMSIADVCGYECLTETDSSASDSSDGMPCRDVLQESSRSPCLLRLSIVLGASHVLEGAQNTDCLMVRPVCMEASPAAHKRSHVVECDRRGPLGIAENPFGRHFSDIKDKAMRAIDAAARSHKTTSIEETREFDEFVRVAKETVPVYETIPMMDYIQGICRRVLKERNPTKLRNPSAGLSSKASKFGRAFVIRMRQALYDHALNFLAANGLERKTTRPDDKQWKTMVKHKALSIARPCGQNVWARKAREGGAARVFANARARARDEATKFAHSKTGKRGCIHSSNHLSSSVSEKMFQLYFKHTGDLYKEIVKEFQNV
jgi:hypothetical protein